MTTFEVGRQAEAAAASLLKSKGCSVLASNWRTRRCEIDIVAKKGSRVYCCEVKYRSHNRQGRGADYITPKKLAQMRYAAEAWVQQAGWQGEYQLCVIEVYGPSFEITNVILDL